MSERITNRDLEGVCKRVNRTVNGTDETPLWVGGEDGTLRASIDVYYITGAYGGVALYRVVNEGGGISDVLGIGHVPKRELYHAIHAFLRGIETVQS